MFSVVALSGFALERPGTMIFGILCLFAVHFLCSCLYSITLHPLAKYPGPVLWTATKLPHAYHTIRGTLWSRVAALHVQYGDVIRIGPNELSFLKAQAWNDIYAVRPGKYQLKKDSTAVAVAPGRTAGLLLTQSDEDHARMRKNFTPGFSDKALREQEPYIVSYIDKLIHKLREQAKMGNDVDVAAWYNYAAFDIIGELYFGESFGNLENGTYSEWIAMIHPGVRISVYTGVIRKLGLGLLLTTLLPKSLLERKRKHFATACEMLDKRIARKDITKPDFVTNVIKNLNTPIGMSLLELQGTSDTLLVAGSETTSTVLTGTTYHLLLNPSKLRIVVDEVRNKFAADSEINMVSVNSLKYMIAVLEESMRIFTPLAGTSARLTSVKGEIICGEYVPPGIAVGVAGWAAYHSPDNFCDPDKFVPERFLGDLRYKGDNMAIFQPWGVGPRNCLGRSLAQAEMRVMLAKLLWSFDFELAPDSVNWINQLKVWYLWEKKPLNVRLTPVTRE